MLESAFCQKETPAHVFSCELCQILKNIFFAEHLWVTAFRPKIMLIIFWDFLILEQIFLSPRVKRTVIRSINLVYTKYLTSCRTTKKLGNSKKMSKVNGNIAWGLPALAKISWKINWILPVVLYFTWKLEFVSNILWMFVPSHLYSLTNCSKNFVKTACKTALTGPFLR